MANETITTIPLTSTGNETITIDLGGTLYRFRTKFNYRGSYWTVDILDTDDVILMAGVALLPGMNLLKGHILGQTLGQLFCRETVEGAHQSDEALGVSVFLQWVAP